MVCYDSLSNAGILRGLKELSLLRSEQASTSKAVATYAAENARLRAAAGEVASCHRWLFCSCRRKARKALRR